MRLPLLFCVGLALFLVLPGMNAQDAQNSQTVHFRSKAAPRGVPWSIEIRAVDRNGESLETFEEEVVVYGVFAHGASESAPVSCRFEQGRLVIDKIRVGDQDRLVELRDSPLRVGRTSSDRDDAGAVEIFTYPGWSSLLPPLIAIALAIVTKEVLLALFIGIWSGVFILGGYHPVESFLGTVDTNIVQALCNADNVKIIVFSLTIGGMVGILANNGGIADMVDRISRYAKTRRSGMIATWFMGLVIFFDDYANSLLVGNSMRPITDRLRISREKLAYIVDSTAAPIASIALVSTWIGTEIKYIGDGLAVHGNAAEAFKFFLASLPYHFYSLFTIVFVFLVGYMRRDYGPMYDAEKRAWTTGEVLGKNAVPLAGDMPTLASVESAKCRWYNAVFPVLIVVAVTLGGLYYTGSQNLMRAGNLENARLMDIIGQSNTLDTLVWASVWGTLAAFLLSVGQRVLSVAHTCKAWVDGLQRVMPAMLVLALAWTLKDICYAMGTSGFIFYGVQDRMTLHLLPFFGFVLSGIVAFATGTSWGTMGLLFPVLLDLAIKLSLDQDPNSLNTGNYIILGTIGSILAGAAWGDHCSPISDTTVMSSMASACDHVDHVKTQMPYALTTAAVSLLFGYLPIGFGVSPWICLPIGCAAMVAVLRYWGRSCEEIAVENGKAND